MTSAKTTRSRAAVLHLLISGLVAAAVTSLILFVWYPSPLFSAVGGISLLPLIVGIDVCLGPLLTFIIFNPQKARRLLVLDISIIGLLQIAALVFGIYAAYEGRPVFIAFAQERFVVVTANVIDSGMLQDARDPRYSVLPLRGPVWVGAEMPLDQRERNSINFDEAVTGMSIHYQPRYYVDLSRMKDQLRNSAQALDKLLARHPEAAAGIDRIANRGATRIEDTGYIPLYFKQRVMIVLAEKKSGAVLGMLDVDPR